MAAEEASGASGVALTLTVTLQRYEPEDVDAYLAITQKALVRGKSDGGLEAMESEAVANQLLVYVSAPRAEWLSAGTYMAVVRVRAVEVSCGTVHVPGANGDGDGDGDPVVVVAIVRKPGDKSLGSLFVMPAATHGAGSAFSASTFALAARALARDVLAAGVSLASAKGAMGSGGVFSTQLFSRCFVDEYQHAVRDAIATTGPPSAPGAVVHAGLQMHMRLYVVTLSTSCPPPRGGLGDGVLRVAGTREGDDRLIARWMVGFVADCFPDHDPLAEDEALKMAQSGIARGATYLWCLRARRRSSPAGAGGSEDAADAADAGTPVSMGECRGHTAHGARLGMIYTPPEHRGNGYASCLTHGINTELLTRHGRSFVCLYTNLANPVSNSVYQSIGYRRVADFEHYDLVHTPVALDAGAGPGAHESDNGGASAGGGGGAAASDAGDAGSDTAGGAGIGCGMGTGVVRSE